MEKVLRAFSVGIIFFATIIAFIVGSRIDQNTVSLLSGAFIGVLVAAPCAAIVTLISLRRRETIGVGTYERTLRHGYQMPPNPPQYWVMPQQFQPATSGAYAPQPIAAGTSAPGWPGATDSTQYLPKPRRFYMIGANGEPTAVQDEDGDATDVYAYDPADTGAVF
jgi:hypothetical protein